MNGNSSQSGKEPVVITADGGGAKSGIKIPHLKMFMGVFAFLFILGGVGVGVYLTQNRQQATTQANLAGPDLSFTPAQVEVGVDETFSADVFINANDYQVTGAQMKIIYDAQFLDLLSLTPKDFLSSVIGQPQISSGFATLALGAPTAEGKAGAGVLATLSFKAKSTGSSEVTFDGAETLISAAGATTDVKNNLSKLSVTITQIEASPQASASDMASSSPLASASASLLPSAQPSASASAVIDNKYDFNGDGKANSIDLSIMYSAWGVPTTDIQRDADLNSDGIVNGIDYSLFLPHFTP